jgi:hypothetical protein
MTASPPVVLPSSTLKPPSSDPALSFLQRKIRRVFLSVIIRILFFLFFNFEILKLGNLKLPYMGSVCKWNQLVEEPENKGKGNVVGELTAGNLLAFDGACSVSTNPMYTSEKDYVKHLMYLKSFT